MITNLGKGTGDEPHYLRGNIELSWTYTTIAQTS